MLLNFQFIATIWIFCFPVAVLPNLGECVVCGWPASAEYGRSDQLGPGLMSWGYHISLELLPLGRWRGQWLGGGSTAEGHLWLGEWGGGYYHHQEACHQHHHHQGPGTWHGAMYLGRCMSGLCCHHRDWGRHLLLLHPLRLWWCVGVGWGRGCGVCLQSLVPQLQCHNKIFRISCLCFESILPCFNLQENYTTKFLVIIDVRLKLWCIPRRRINIDKVGR